MRAMEDASSLLDLRSRPATRARPAHAPVGDRGLVVRWARHLDEIREAQRLRYQVFAVEMGASLSVLPGMPDDLDVDRFDDYCEHLIVRTREGRDEPSEVVGTYRVLTPDGARRAGALYSDAEFDLAALDELRARMAELGRSCTAPQWRQGGVILLLWSALAEFMQRNGLGLMVGCASVPMLDGGHGAASLWARLRERHLAPESLRVRPRLPLPVERLDNTLEVEPPPLIKGYLRCGAKILGAPAWDPDFGVADLPMLLDLEDLPASYRTRFVRA
jgi:putative hemolysin